MGYIVAGDFRKGETFVLETSVQQIIDFQHVKPGKGAAFVRCKIKNVISGQVVERTFNPSEKFETAFIETKKMSYNYQDGDLFYFMDSDTYDLIPLEKSLVEEAMHFIKEESPVTVKFYKGNAFTVEPENFVELEIVETEPGMPNATAQAVQKPAKLETGYTIAVPAFISQGEKVRIDTRSGQYMSRA